MTVLVSYASKYGGTRGIAELIAKTLAGSGVEAVAQATSCTSDLSGYEAFVLGSALYMGSWMKEALIFARQNHDILTSRPVWLFSSGPLGTATTDARGQDVRDSAGPRQLPELRELLGARDHHVFFGVSDHTHFDLRDKLIYAVPGGRKLLVDGDFRDWSDVENWANEIAHALESGSA
jgi:menaquinone-dependent protoporphyrinogen oxidase